MKKPSLLFTCLGVIIVLISLPPGEAKKKVNYCNIDSFFDCFLFSLARFTHQTNGTGIPRNDEEFEELCSMFHDVQPYCIQKYTERCGSPISKVLLFNLWSKRLQESYTKFCDPKLPYRKAFVKHAPCLIEKVKLAKAYREDCVRNFQADNEFLYDFMESGAMSKPGALTRIVRGTCCVYNNWENCIVKHLRNECGNDAAETMSAGDIFPFLIHHSAIMVPVQLCVRSRYNELEPTNECIKEEYTAPADFVPNGINSKSYPSHFFSLSCPNVGYGIDPEKDKGNRIE